MYTSSFPRYYNSKTIICEFDKFLEISFSDIYTFKMENDVLIPPKPSLHRRFIDGTYSRRKLGDNILFDYLNNYHLNIKLTIELNPSNLIHQT